MKGHCTRQTNSTSTRQLVALLPIEPYKHSAVFVQKLSAGLGSATAQRSSRTIQYCCVPAFGTVTVLSNMAGMFGTVHKLTTQHDCLSAHPVAPLPVPTAHRRQPTVAQTQHWPCDMPQCQHRHDVACRHATTSEVGVSQPKNMSDT